MHVRTADNWKMQSRHAFRELIMVQHRYLSDYQIKK